MVKNLNGLWFQLFGQELDELWCLLIWFTWTIVNPYWSIGSLQSLVLKEHQWWLDNQYSPQGIDESLKWFKLVHFNSWLWHKKTHGHNATEKLSNSTQQSLNKDELQGVSLKQQDILRVYSVVTTGIGKLLDTPSKFQLQPNEEITQHAPRQVLTYTQELPGNQSTMKPGEEMVGHENSLEIEDDKVPADFNTGKHQFTTKTENLCKLHLDSSESTVTERLDSFLDGLGIVDAVPANLNTGQVPHDWKGPFPGLTRKHDNYNFKSPTIHQAETWKNMVENVFPFIMFQPWKCENMKEYGGKCVSFHNVSTMKYSGMCLFWAVFVIISDVNPAE